MKNLSPPNRPISDLELAFVVNNERQREGGAGADCGGEPPGGGGRQLDMCGRVVQNAHILW